VKAPERNDDLAQLASLIRRQRWAALATVEADGAPCASSVAYAPEADFAGFLLHLSQLAPHTRNLLVERRASLVISDQDPGAGDPQTLMRLSLLGSVHILEKESAEFAAGKALYLSHLPTAAPLFGFPDFILFRFAPQEARFVGGFARARRMDTIALREAAKV
jgi:putative heme iron utilization protein